MSKYLAGIVDASEPPQAEGYTAKRHDFYPNIILVWAPCGCVWISDKEDRFVTPCGKDNCQFEWSGVKEAVAALQAAETSVEVKGVTVTQGEKDGLGLLPVQCVDSTSPDLPADGGGVPAESQTADAEIEGMISEGGPVQP